MIWYVSIIYMATSFHLKLGLSSGHKTKTWKKYTETKTVKLETSPFYIKKKHANVCKMSR